MMNFFRSYKNNDQEKWKKSKELEEFSEYIEKLKSLTNELSTKEDQICSIQEDYKKIFNLFSDSVVILDDELNIIDLNKKAQFLFSELFNKQFVAIGKNWKETILDNLNCDFNQTIEKRAVDSDTNKELSKEIYIKDINKHFLISIIPVIKRSYEKYYIFVGRNITKIKLRETDLIKKQKLIVNIDSITELLSKNLNINYTMEKIVEILGNLEKVDMCYIYRNCHDDKGNLISEKMKDWRSREFIKNTYTLDILPYEEFPRWLEYFRINHIICGHIEKFPKNERTLLEVEQIKSICIVPIYTPMGLWGFVGFDSCLSKRHWTFDEERLLKIAANIIGSGIYQWELRDNHEDIVKKCINFR